MKQTTGAQAESNRKLTVVRRGTRMGGSGEGASCWHWNWESQQKGFASFLSIICIIFKFTFQKNLKYYEISTLYSHELIKLYFSFTKFRTLQIHRPASCSLVWWTWTVQVLYFWFLSCWVFSPFSSLIVMIVFPCTRQMLNNKTV